MPLLPEILPVKMRSQICVSGYYPESDASIIKWYRFIHVFLKEGMTRYHLYFSVKIVWDKSFSANILQHKYLTRVQNKWFPIKPLHF